MTGTRTSGGLFASASGMKAVRAVSANANVRMEPRVRGHAVDLCLPIVRSAFSMAVFFFEG
jgi:hypothetical protein